MDSPLADWRRLLYEGLLSPRVSGLAHPGRSADDVLRDMLVLMGTVRFAEALRESPETCGQSRAREKLNEMCLPVEAAVERLADRIRRNEAQRHAIGAKMSVLARLAGDKPGWTGALHSFRLHQPLSREVICMCQAAEIGVGPELYQKSLPQAAEQALDWLRERF